MTAETKKAILAVSFGTSHNDTRKVTIDAIEKRYAGGLSRLCTFTGHGPAK